MKKKHRHKWIPLSFVFETQLLDHEGRVLARQPCIEKGRVYCVCMGCHRHTYIETKWLGGPDINVNTFPVAFAVNSLYC